METPIPEVINSGGGALRGTSTARLATALLVVSGFSAGMWLALEFAATTVHPPTEAQVASIAETVLAKNMFANIDLLAGAAIVIDIDTGTLLYEKNADAQLPLASLTKVPLMLAVSEVLPRDSILTIPRDTTPTSAADILRAGSEWHAGDLIAYTLVGSSNDGAQILARRR